MECFSFIQLAPCKQQPLQFHRFITKATADRLCRDHDFAQDSATELGTVP